MRLKGMLGLAAAILAAVGLTLYFLSPTQGQTETQLLNLETLNRVKLTVVYDNYPYKPGLKTAWGFSCLVEADNTKILFDTGGNPEILLLNLEALGFNPEDLDLVVLSHIHGDHTGGLEAVLSRNPKITVALPASFPENFKEQLRELGCSVVEVSSPRELCPGVGTTGVLGGMVEEQALIVRTCRGLLIVTGCAHPGVDRMVARAVEATGVKPYMVIGGFHLAGASESRILDIALNLKSLGVEAVAPCHCSGDEARKVFREVFGGGYVRAGVGLSVTVTSGGLTVVNH